MRRRSAGKRALPRVQLGPAAHGATARVLRFARRPPRSELVAAAARQSGNHGSKREQSTKSIQPARCQHRGLCDPGDRAPQWRSAMTATRHGRSLIAALLAVMLIGALVASAMFATTEGTKVGSAGVARDDAVTPAE